jgi:hypothetical protein
MRRRGRRMPPSWGRGTSLLLCLRLPPCCCDDGSSRAGAGYGDVVTHDTVCVCSCVLCVSLLCA